MKVTWTLADDLLASLSSWTDRLPILERLVTIDLPVPGGSGAEQYRYVKPFPFFTLVEDKHLQYKCAIIGLTVYPSNYM